MASDPSRALVAAPPKGDLVSFVKTYESAQGTTLQETAILIKNGMYYQTTNNPVSALVSYSCAATYLHALAKALSVSDPSEFAYADVLSRLLGYIEALQEKVKHMNGGGKKEEETSNWDTLCVNMCEVDSKSLCISFADVIGMEREKNLMEINIIKPLVYKNLYTKSSKGVLLYGPPGTGKTYLVKAAIRELQNRFKEQVQVLFFNKTGADLKGKYVGETEKRIVEVYTCAARRACEMTDASAKTTSKCASKEDRTNKTTQYVSVIFIDEFDSIGRDRSADESGLAANAVNTLLQMMDGVESYKNVITVAATNNPWDLDPALLRRFNEHIYVKLPKFEEVKKLVTYEMRDRFKLVETDLAAYCGKTVGNPKKGVYKRSPEFAEKYAKEGSADPCAKTDTSVFPLHIIDQSYIANSSDAMLAAISEMTEKHYSNSDISSVMQKAFNNVSEKCLQLGSWKKISDAAQTYYISNFTKLMGTYPMKAEIEKENQQIEMIAQSADANSDTITYNNIYVDLDELQRNNAFNPVGESLKHVVGNITYDGKTYVNLKFIKDPPSYLLFNDATIQDIYFDTTEIRGTITVDSEINVIFTRVINVTNDLTAPTNDAIDQNNKHIKTLTKGKELNLDDLKQEMKPGVFPWSGKKVSELSQYNEIINPVDDVINALQINNIDKLAEKIAEKLDYKGHEDPSVKDLVNTLVHAGAESFETLNEEIKKYTLTPKELDYALIAAYIPNYNTTWFVTRLTQDGFKALMDVLIEYIEEQTKLLKSDLQGGSSRTQKLFFFKSTIKPKSANWAQHRASSSIVMSGIGNAFATSWNWMKSWVITKDDSNAEKEVAAYLSSARTSALDYLLARITDIGLCSGITDRDNIYGKPVSTQASVAITRGGGSRKQLRNKRNNTFRIQRNSKKHNYESHELEESQVGGDINSIYWVSFLNTGITISQKVREMASYRIPSFLRLISGFEKEADMSVEKLIMKAMFTKSDFFVSSTSVNFKNIFNNIHGDYFQLFNYNYDKSLKELNYNFATSPIKLDKDKLKVNLTDSKYAVKHIAQEAPKPDYSGFLSFYVDGSFLSGAIAEYPSTYNEQIVNMLNIYDTNRTDFYARKVKGEFDKKK